MQLVLESILVFNRFLKEIDKIKVECEYNDTQITMHWIFQFLSLIILLKIEE